MRVGPGLAHDLGALFAQPAFVAAVPAIELLLFLAARQLDLGGVDDDDVVAGVDKRGIGRLVLALQQPGCQGRDAAEHLAVGVNDVPAAVDGFRGSYIRPHETRFLCVPGRSDRSRLGEKRGTTVNPNLTWCSGDCQVSSAQVDDPCSPPIKCTSLDEPIAKTAEGPRSQLRDRATKP